jgi:hypothetical protein
MINKIFLKISMAFLLGSISNLTLAQNSPILKNNWWYVNGQVFSTLESNNKVYVGGDFDEVIFPKERLALINMSNETPQGFFPPLPEIQLTPLFLMAVVAGMLEVILHKLEVYQEPTWQG